jgi:hypothetical protein
MTPRSLFNIILKILGIFFIKDILASIPQLFVAVAFLGKPETMPEAVWTLVAAIAVILVDVFICYILVFKTDRVINILKLESGFDQETIPLNMHRSTILSISIIVIGGYLLVESIPNFCRQLFLYFQEKRMTHGQTTPSIQYTVIYGIKIVISILLIAEQRLIVNLIERQRKK